MIEYVGEIAVARITDVIDNKPYKYAACFETGHLRGEECLILRNGIPGPAEYAVARFFPVASEKFKLTDDERRKTAFYATSHVPDGFEFSTTENTIFHGKWGTSIGESSDPQNIRDIMRYYHMGPSCKALYYFANEEGIYYTVFSWGNPVDWITGEGDEEIVDITLSSYLNEMCEKRNVMPRIVITDDNMKSETLIKPFVESRGLTYLELEPQR